MAANCRPFPVLHRRLVLCLPPVPQTALNHPWSQAQIHLQFLPILCRPVRVLQLQKVHFMMAIHVTLTLNADRGCVCLVTAMHQWVLRKSANELVSYSFFSSHVEWTIACFWNALECFCCIHRRRNWSRDKHRLQPPWWVWGSAWRLNWFKTFSGFCSWRCFCWCRHW